MWSAVELRELRVFVTLTEELHFGRTAERLQLTPSRVSQTLRELEAKLGGELLHRTSRRVTLTPLGERRAGREIRRLARRPKTPHEVTALIARGRIVHPTVPSFEYFGQPGVTYVPIRDMPPLKSGLVWRRRASNPRLREFVRLAREMLG